MSATTFACPLCKTGKLQVARLQWHYTLLWFDPTRYRPQDARESVFPGDRSDSAFTEDATEEKGDIDERDIACDSCTARFNEDDPMLVAQARTRAGIVPGETPEEKLLSIVQELATAVRDLTMGWSVSELATPPATLLANAEALIKSAGGTWDVEPLK